MDIIINDRRKIFAIQEEFNQLFPYLKIEFFAKPDKKGGSHSDKTVLYSKSLSECRTIHNSGSITITSQMMVSDLEKGFRDVYGLEIQVLRKSGHVWLPISATESWTLEEQNKQGENLDQTLKSAEQI